MRVRLVLCLPTYNEIQNLEPMVRALGEIFAREALDGRVLVIDDASPDGTGELADRLATELRYVDVLHRKAKQGLGPAYIAGFRRALADGAELIMEMDCDFSHAPDDVPRLVRETSRADLVIGSRYVPGGRVENWGAGRRLVSRAGSVYARLVLGIDVRDLTGGFKCFRRVVLDTGASTGDYARSWTLQASDDASRWRTLARGSGTGQLTTIDLPRTRTRYLRLISTGSAVTWWSVADIRLYD